MLNEKMEEGIEIKYNKFEKDKKKDVKRIDEKRKMMKNDVVKIINYKDDDDLEKRDIKEIIKILKDEDKVVV